MNKYYFIYKNEFDEFELGTKLGTFTAPDEVSAGRLANKFVDEELYRTKFGAIWAFNRLGIKDAVVIVPAYEGN